MYNVKIGSIGTVQSVGGLVLNNPEDVMFVDYADNKDFQFLDFHLRHQSPAIDIGDPSSDYFNEPAPNGDRINAGIYGTTFFLTTLLTLCIWLSLLQFFLWYSG